MPSTRRRQIRDSKFSSRISNLESGVSVFSANAIRILYTRRVTLWIVAAIVFALNLPFGYWRAHVPKFSRQWILAVHLPVPLVIACRLLSGLGFQLITYPVMIGAFFIGQFVGGKLVGQAADPGQSR